MTYQEISHKIILYKKSIEDVHDNVNFFTETMDKIKNLENNEVYLNFEIDDTYLLEYFQISMTKYKILNSEIEKIINLMTMLHYEVATSEENKQKDNLNYSLNESAKKIFLNNYPNNRIKYIKALSLIEPNRIQKRNEKNKKRIENLNFSFKNKELLNGYKISESMRVGNITNTTLANDIKFLAKQHIGKILKESHFNEITKLISEEVNLRIGDFNLVNEDISNEIVSMIEDLRVKQITDRLDSLKKETNSPEELWDKMFF